MLIINFSVIGLGYLVLVGSTVACLQHHDDTKKATLVSMMSSQPEVIRYELNSLSIDVTCVVTCSHTVRHDVMIRSVGWPWPGGLVMR